MKSGERDLEVAIEVAREAGALLRQNFGKAQEVDFKGRGTEADLTPLGRSQLGLSPQGAKPAEPCVTAASV